MAEALRRLALRGWSRLTSGAGSRARKYRHLLPEALEVSEEELALLAVLMLRGIQTPGELKQRVERLHRFEDLAAVHSTLDRLVERDLAVRHQRRPGQKEDRYEQVLGGQAAQGSSDIGPEEQGPTQIPTALTAALADPPPDPDGSEAARLERLEADLLALRADLASLREALGEGGSSA